MAARFSLWAGVRPRVSQPVIPSARLLAGLRAEEMAVLRLATRARLAALGAAAVVLFFLEPTATRYWYEAVILVLAVSGVAQHRLAARFDREIVGSLFVAIDAATMVVGLVYLTARLHPEWPPQMALRTAPVAYLFLLICYVAVSYSARLTLWAGVCTSAAWGVGLLWLAVQPGTPSFARIGVSPSAQLQLALDPNFVNLAMGLEEVAVLLISAAMLAVLVRRSRGVVVRQVRAASERANLARYFSPSVVDELAGRDEPLGPVRRQEVGVLFADLVGFTSIAESTSPEEVMALLRGFHSRMEREVFGCRGTLEKFIGDALLATFGVPHPGEHDASDTIRCAYGMLASLDRWNGEREERGESRLRMGIGVHFGPAVLGDIGNERNMAFAVVGDTVNTGSRLQSLTRTVGCDLVASSALVDTVRLEDGGCALLERLEHGGARRLRGRGEDVSIWVLPHAPGETVAVCEAELLPS